MILRKPAVLDAEELAMREYCQRGYEDRFDRELQYQALTNPNFVATRRTQQDRH